MISVHMKVSPSCPMRRAFSLFAEGGSKMLSEALKVPPLVSGKAGFEPRFPPSEIRSYCPAPTAFPHEDKQI